MREKRHIMVFGNFPGFKSGSRDCGGDGKLRTRITEDETRHYRYAMGYNAIHEEDDYGGMLATNVFEPGASNGPRLAQMMFGTLTGGLPVYAYHDHLGTVRQWRFANKNSARAIEYDPYGNIYGQSGFFNMPRIYAHHEFDSALKQYRAPFRHYRPTMARWTTSDPMGMIDGPNMYAYVKGKPVYQTDCLGLFSVDGCCGGNEAEIRREVQNACQKVKHKIDGNKCPHLFKCLERRCKDGKIRCKQCNRTNLYGTGYIFTNRANICANNILPGLFGEVVIHEWAHTCGWLHEGSFQTKKCGVPCADGECRGEEGW